MKIVVTGSIGHISLPLVKELLKNGHTVTIISSNTERKKDIEALGAIAAIGSLEEDEFLNSALTDADALYAMIPPNYTSTDVRAYYQKIGNTYAKAIQQSGVKRVVHLSSMGAELDKGTGLILGSHDVEVILNKLADVSVTHLRPGYFYYNLLNFVGMIKGLGFIGANYGGDDKIAMAAPRDIASAASEELVKTESGGVRYIVSDDITASSAAHILGSAIGRPELRWTIFTDEQALDGMLKNGLPKDFAAKFVELGASLHSGVLRQHYDLNKPASMGKTKLADFAKDFAAAFNA